MAAILDALRGRLAQREANAHDTIAAGARAAARGDAYDSGAIERAMLETGKTLADFERAVDVARKRSEWLADFDRLASATAKAKKLETAAALEQSKMEAARKAFLERAAAIDAELAILRTACEKGNAARGNLLDPREVPAGTVGDRYREAVIESEAAQSAVERAQRDVREQTARIRSEEQWIAQLTGDANGPKRIKPSVLPSLGPQPQPDEPHRVQEHRLALTRAQRRKAEAEAALIEAEKVAARCRKAVDALIPDVLKS
jgi:hypothetical protein